MAYHRYHGIDTKIVRIFNTYGPRMRLRDGRVVPAFIGEALSGKPFTVFGDGSQTRSFCYVSDLIDGIFKLAQSDFHEPVNIGNPREMTIKQFAEEIIRITGNEDRRSNYKPLPVDDPKVRQPDISRAKKILRLGTESSFRRRNQEDDRIFSGRVEECWLELSQAAVSAQRIFVCALVSLLFASGANAARYQRTRMEGPWFGTVRAALRRK